jgi:hypothetical protein
MIECTRVRDGNFKENLLILYILNSPSNFTFMLYFNKKVFIRIKFEYIRVAHENFLF